jgi:hypothetical protein
VKAQELALVLTAVFTGSGTVLTAYASLLKERRSIQDDCNRKLRKARLDAERIASDLHALRMERARS